MSGIEKLQFEHTQIFHIFGLEVKRCNKKSLLALPKSHEFLIRGEYAHVDTPPPTIMAKVKEESLIIA